MFHSVAPCYQIDNAMCRPYSKRHEALTNAAATRQVVVAQEIQALYTGINTA